MNFGHESVVQEIRPGSARVLVTELSDSENINPTPAGKPCEVAEAADEPYLSPRRLVSSETSVSKPLGKVYSLISYNSLTFV